MHLGMTIALLVVSLMRADHREEALMHAQIL